MKGLQCIFFWSFFWFDSFLNPIKFDFIRSSVCTSAGTLTPNFFPFFFVFRVGEKPSRQFETEADVCQLDQCVSSFAPLPYSERDLISSVGLITQQMGTECSVTKTKTNPELDYECVVLCVCLCESSQNDQL